MRGLFDFIDYLLALLVVGIISVFTLVFSVMLRIMQLERYRL